MQQLTADAPRRAPGRPDDRGSEATGRRAALWRSPLWAHAAALALVLVALMPVVGTRASFSADEGAAIVQARHLSRGQGWIVDHPLPQADPHNSAYPLELSLRGDRGSAPFAKHPLYAVLLAGADRVGGTGAMVGLSVAGTLAAAVIAALLARRIRPSLARPSLWAVGLATPLLFDGSLVIAHTLGAACAAGALLLALRAIETGHRRPAAIVGAASCLVAAVLLRNEAVFWALALALAVGALAVSRRSRALAATAGGTVALAALAHVGEQAWIGRILGGHVRSPAAATATAGNDQGLLAARLHAAALTWLRPGYGQFPTAEVALVVMLAAVVVGTIAVRRHPGDGRAVLALGGAAALAAVTALVVAPTNLVPGLLVACPVLAAGLVAVRRPTLDSLAARLLLGTFALFALAVLATQYSTGGSGEWGGRYFALGLPAVVPVALLALADAGAALARRVRGPAVGCLVVCVAATAAMGVASIRDTHRFTAHLMASASHAGQSLGGDGRPVMLATNGAVPRLAWATFDRQRWLLADPGELAALGRRLSALGERDVVLVTNDLPGDLGRLGPGTTLVKRDVELGRHEWQVAVLRLAA